MSTPTSAPAPPIDGTPLCVADYEPLAAARTAVDVWDYISGGSGAEQTLAANRASYGRWALRPRGLVDVSRCDPATTLLGDPVAAPIGVAPMAYHRLVHPEGEVATARAAGAAGLPLIASIFASRTLEDMAAAATGPLWLQLYWLRDRGALRELVARAAAAGFRALVLTVDAPRVGRRLRDLRRAFAVPDDVVAVNLDSAVTAEVHESRSGVSAIEQHSRDRFDPSVTWADLAWLREISTLPIVLKGVLTAEDAELAARHGIDAVVVSNHGGRQLDGAVTALDALPEIVAALDGRLPALLDGGIRTGTDVLKALALGAAGVLVGRPVLWGLAVDGAAGARHVLDLLVAELTEAMVLAGRPRPADVDRTLVRRIGCGH